VSDSLQSIGAITLFVEDAKRSKTFYESVFARPPIWEDENSVVFQFDKTVVNLLATSAVGDLIEPAKVATQEAGSRLLLSIWVDDTDAVCAELARRGVELLNGPIDRWWGKRTACFADPDGHLWEVAQDIPPTGAP
jgi:catechol 2,3-dioxygenase-like lactoylglutathione lyase family enzyme